MTCPVRVLQALILTVSWAASAAGHGAEAEVLSPARVGLVVAAGPEGPLEPEVQAVFDFARTCTSAVLIRAGGKEPSPAALPAKSSLDGFALLWLHGAGNTPPGFSAATLQAVERRVSGGQGLLLTGAAVRLVESWKLDRVQGTSFSLGEDRAQSGMIPSVKEHPVFRELDLDGGVAWTNNVLYPAFDSFRLELGRGGQVLARAAGGLDHAILEYPLGQGRVIAVCSQVSPLYQEAAPGFRMNAQRLVRNLCAYLADRGAWRPTGATAPPSESSSAIAPGRWERAEGAIRDLAETFGSRYPNGPALLERLAALQREYESAAKRGDAEGASRCVQIAADLDRLLREAILSNPLLDFSRLVVVRRGAGKLGLPTNYQSNSSLEKTGYENEIAIVDWRSGTRSTLYRPDEGRFVGDVDLHFDAERLLFSMPCARGTWQVFEIRADGSGLREVPLLQEPDVDNYDACYLPDDRIAFTSTACFTGVPCVNGSGHVASLYRQEQDGSIRQLTVEQDHDWCPTVLANGRLLYLRWEYTDLPHAFSRILFHMNPDGTEQVEYYGSNSYWPASMFFARPIPGHPTKVVAVVGGHHELPRMGELVVFDPARGRQEAEGAVQRIPGHGRPVEPVLLDLPIAESWPKFLHPYPLSEKHFLVAAKPSAQSPWGIYLADTFDHLVKVYDEPGWAILEPIPLRKTARPRVIPDRIDRARRDADVLVADVYRGEGLRGVPRGTIKQMRVLSYEFAYQGMGAEPYSVGLDGPWDPKIVLGTVPVAADGSARFRVPAYTPIALQPLDAEGKAVQLMRSWFTAMPGEVVTCVGCHEKQNTSPPVHLAQAIGGGEQEVRPWYGRARGFSFRREVQPVLDKHCADCHERAEAEGRPAPSLRDGPTLPCQDNTSGINLASRFSASYYHLRRFVRTPTKEADLRLLPPWEFHADTTRLVQLLAKGHYGVQLDREAWDRLVTWIDLNAPFHGSWAEIRGDEIAETVAHQVERRRALRLLTTGIDDDSLPSLLAAAREATPAARIGRAAGALVTAGAVAAGKARPAPALAAAELRRPSPGPVAEIMLEPGVSLSMVQIPAGEFVMGEGNGYPDEGPCARVAVAEPFWMGRFEVTNRQYAAFDPRHDSRLEHGDFIQFSPLERGWPLNLPEQPVVRVPWQRAMEFCRWLSAKTGARFALPTEAQWEYACRAGTTTPLAYGNLETDFAPWANLSDATHQAIDPAGWVDRPKAIPPWRPADVRFNDGARVSAPVGSYRANAWGLCDMHGNAAEWTRSVYRPYPYDEDDGRNAATADGKKVVRGGSWYDMPRRARSACRQAYAADRGVYDVGFRVIATGLAHGTEAGTGPRRTDFSGISSDRGVISTTRQNRYDGLDAPPPR